GLAALVSLRRAFLVASACYGVALVLVFFLYDERITHVHARDDADTAASVTFRNVLAFENFLLMALVIFAFQFVDRSFGPVLPLFVGALGTPDARIAFVSGLLFSIAAGRGALGPHLRSPPPRHPPPLPPRAAAGRGGVRGGRRGLRRLHRGGGDALAVRGDARIRSRDRVRYDRRLHGRRRGHPAERPRARLRADDDGELDRDGPQSDRVR